MLSHSTVLTNLHFMIRLYQVALWNTYSAFISSTCRVLVLTCFLELCPPILH